MSKFLLITVLIALSLRTVIAQSANFIHGIGISYQGYAQDDEGAAISSKKITAKFVLKNGNVAVYTEEIEALTDAYGVFSAVIGPDNATEFSKLTFSSVFYTLDVFVKIGESSSYTLVIENANLASVPYAHAAGNGVMIGTMLPFAGKIEDIEEGWMPCDGRSLNKETYSLLFEKIGYAWGGGGNTFKIPNTGGYFLRGVDPNAFVDLDAKKRKPLGNNQPDQVGSLQEDEIKKHSHEAGSFKGKILPIPRKTGDWTEESGYTMIWDKNDFTHGKIYPEAFTSFGPGNRPSFSDVKHVSHFFDNREVIFEGESEGTGGAETRPKNISVNYIIRVH